MKKIRFGMLVLLLLTMLFALTACGGVAKKGKMTLYAPAERLEALEKGFGKYFEVTMADSTNPKAQQGQERYAVVFSGSEQTVSVPDGGFLITIDDHGSPIEISMRYMVGAKQSGAAVINPNIVSGGAEVTNDFSFTPKQGSQSSQEELVASVIYEQLKDIEGK